jgi:hypothetical protein
MSRCTAPVRGHSSAAAAAACPACRNRYGSRYSSYSSSYGSTASNGGTSISNSARTSVSNSGKGTGISKPRWSKATSSIAYTSNQVVSLTPVREVIEKKASKQPDLRDVFLCHAWDDRKGAAKELHDYSKYLA